MTRKKIDALCTHVYIDVTFVTYFALMARFLLHLPTSTSLLCIEICSIPLGIGSFIDIRFCSKTS